METSTIISTIQAKRHELGSLMLSLDVMAGDSVENLVICDKADKIQDEIDRLERTIAVRQAAREIKREAVNV